MTTYVHDLGTFDPDDVDLLGGKGAGLGRMHALGLPVPPAFVIDTAACGRYRADSGHLPDGLVEDITRAVTRLAEVTGKSFGGGADGLPLLVAVRSGAKVSMPGMMDTVLNLGLDRHSVLRLAEASGDPEFAVDTWMRFWAMFADIVLDVDAELLRQSVDAEHKAATADLTPSTAAALEDAVLTALDAEGVSAPTDPHAQLIATTRAVFASWDSRRAKAYRAHHGIPDDLGTAVVVQAMVFGNLRGLSGSGVAFTRDPQTGENRLYGEFLAGGQGEEVVAGTKTPVNLTHPQPEWAEPIAELDRLGRLLEQHYRDALDIEFTVEQGTLYLLQVRAAKRTAAAAVRTACEQVDEGLITPATALGRVSAEQVRKLVAPAFDAEAMANADRDGLLLIRGIAASPGHGSGVAVLDADRAAQRAADGTPVILVRPTTSPQDLPGMLAAQAVVTARGGATSHAAVVARALDKPCVVGCAELDVDPDAGTFGIDGRNSPEGTWLSVDGDTGAIYLAQIPRVAPESNREVLASLLGWADETSGAQVWTPRPGGVGVGVGVLSLTDLMLGAGTLNALLDALTVLSENPAADVTAALSPAIRDALDPLPGEEPVHLRLPVLTSARARREIDEWASLAPDLLRPLGSPALLDAYLTAIAQADKQVTVLIGGITNPAELAEFTERAAGAGLPAGALLANPAVLFEAEQFSGIEAELWIDLPELCRAAYGHPAELLFSLEGGLAPLVEHLLSRIGAVAPEVGIDLAGTAGTGLIADLHRWGFRRFATSVGHLEALRLQLGHAAISH